MLGCRYKICPALLVREIENRKTTMKISETKSCFFKKKKISEVDKALARLTKIKRANTHHLHQEWNRAITTDPAATKESLTRTTSIIFTYSTTQKAQTNFSKTANHHDSVKVK